jgi:uncharacterized protein (DUF362 family)
MELSMDATTNSETDSDEIIEHFRTEIRASLAPCGEKVYITDQGGRNMEKHSSWKWLAALTGMVSLAWFLVRVIPKPSRAAYPCQRAAAPLASGFVIWVVGLVGARTLYGRAKGLAHRCRYAMAVTALALAVVALWLPLGVTTEAIAQRRGGPLPDPFTPTDPPNQPIGVGKGIHPGRVVWVHEPDATNWDGTKGDWWDDTNSDQRLVDDMVSRALRSLTGQQTDKQAWEALFRHFNQTRKLREIGYRPGDKITVKINANQDRSDDWRTGRGMPSPQVVYALLDQLINTAGVPGEDITIYDASRYIGGPIYNRVRANSNPNFQAVKFVVSPRTARDGRLAAERDKTNPIHFAQSDLPAAYPPKCVTGAKYLINLALLRAHTMFGVTLTAKNHFGSVYFPNNGGWTPRPLHSYGSRSRPMGSYNCLVDLIGHSHLGGKTLLYMLDGLYSAEHNEGDVIRFASFGDDWPSSLFMSQDPVAIDSVGLDFLRNEPRATQVRGNPDNYLHDAALADDPPSGTMYDPEQDGVRLASLGVHEHWNNPIDKQYSRNLGKNKGIELVALSKTMKISRRR